MIVDFSTENKREMVPEPPFLGVRSIDAISLKAIFPYLNKKSLFKQQWRLSDAHHGEAIAVLARLAEQSVQEAVFSLKARYGYFRCHSEQDNLIIYHPQNDLKELCEFHFPRQQTSQHRCLAGFFSSKSSGLYDLIAFQLVTIGQKASDFEHQLFEQDCYQDSFYWHGFNAEATNALAEWMHQHIRLELGFAASEPDKIEDLFQQKYRGARYSLGYPACPNLEDQIKILNLLQADRMGVKLGETFQLWPEYSTSAFILHHPNAKQY